MTTRRSAAARGAAVAAAILALAACGRPGVRIEAEQSPSADLAAYATWTWARPALAGRGPGPADEAERLDRRIRGAVERGLAARGYRRGAGREGDLVVDYDVRLRERSTETFRDYVQYRADGGTKDMGAAWMDGYLQGTLELELLDARTRALVWRGVAEGMVDQEAPGRRADEVVARLLERLPAR